MMVANSDGSGHPAETEKLLEGLGGRNWRVRKKNVQQLATSQSEDVAKKVLEKFCDQHRDFSSLNAALQILTKTSADIVPDLILRLSEPDPDLRSYVALALGERGDIRAIPDLIHALADANTNVRVHATEALGKLRAASAVDALLAIVESGDFEVAFPALDALTLIGDQRIVHRILPLLQDPFLKHSAIDAIGALGSEEFIRPLLELLTDEVNPASSIAQAVYRIYRRYQTLFQMEEEIAELVRAYFPPEPLVKLVAALPGASPSEISALVWVIGCVPGDNATTALIDAISLPAGRQEAYNAMAKRGPSVLPLLKTRLTSANRDDLPFFIELLGRIGDDSCVSPLETLAKSDDEEIALEAIAALVDIGSPSCYQAMKMQLGNPNPPIRQAAVIAIHSLGHSETSADVQKLLGDVSPLVRESAVKLAAHLGLVDCLEAVLSQAKDPDERIRRVVIESLPWFDSARVLPLLSTALVEETPAVRAAAAKACGELRGEAIPALLETALQDDDLWVRYFAARSIGQPPHAPFLGEKLQIMAASDPAFQVRIAATEALGNAGATFVPFLVSLTDSEDPDLANGAITALGKIGHPSVLPCLEAALTSDLPTTRHAATRALAESRLPQAISILFPAAISHDAETSEEAITAIAQIDSPELAESLLRVARIPAKRDFVVATLARRGNDLIPQLAQSLLHADLDVRRAIVEVLTQIGTAPAVDVLETTLSDVEPTVRHAALFALANLQRRDLPKRTGDSGKGNR